jgi:hypothetical protein
MEVKMVGKMIDSDFKNHIEQLEAHNIVGHELMPYPLKSVKEDYM